MDKKAVSKLTRLRAHVTAEIQETQAMWHNVVTTPGVVPKLKCLRREMFDKRVFHTLIEGFGTGKITHFAEDFYAKMNNTYISGLPVAMGIKYFQPNKDAKDGKCFARSFAMFMCFDDALWVQGNNKCLALAHGKEKARHAWIEIGDDVYDPTSLLKFPKDLYYKMLKVSNVVKYTHAEYLQAVPDAVTSHNDIKATTLADFQPNGRKRELLRKIPKIKATAAYANNPEFQKDLAIYLAAVQYDEKEFAPKTVEILGQGLEL